MAVPEPHLRVLRRIHHQLADGAVTWVVTGSTGFALQGLPVVPGDIDIQTDEAGAYEIERRFAGCATGPVALRSDATLRSHFGALLLDGIAVEIMGDIRKRDADGAWEPPTDLARHRRFLTVEDLRLPVLALEYEHEAYLRLGRVEQAALLRRWLDRGRADEADAAPGPA